MFRGRTIADNDEHSAKHPLPIDDTLVGIVISCNDVHLLKHLYGSDLIFVGRTTNLSDEQYSKHFLPIDVTLDGITISSNDEQFEKHCSGSDLMFVENVIRFKFLL